MVQKRKIKTLLFLAALLPLAASAQFSLQPIPSSGFGDVNDNEVPVTATIANLSDTVLNLLWERQIISLTPGCETAISDPYIGWAPFFSSRNLDLMPHEIGPLNVNFLNNGAPCAGIIRLKVSNRNNPLDTLIGVYLFNQSTGTGGNQQAVKARLFPNPATSFFSLDHDAVVISIRLLDLNGREMLRFQSRSGKTYNIDQLPAGNFVVVLEGKDGAALQALALEKL